MNLTLRNYNTRKEKEFDLLSQYLTLYNNNSEPRILLRILDAGQYIFKPK